MWMEPGEKNKIILVENLNIQLQWVLALMG
jgi:hypothetical protein